jgi:hypothetical protein
MNRSNAEGRRCVGLRGSEAFEMLEPLGQRATTIQPVLWRNKIVVCVRIRLFVLGLFVPPVVKGQDLERSCHDMRVTVLRLDRERDARPWRSQNHLDDVFLSSPNHILPIHSHQDVTDLYSLAHECRTSWHHPRDLDLARRHPNEGNANPTQLRLLGNANKKC